MNFHYIFSCPVTRVFRQYAKMSSIHSAMEQNYISSLELLCSQRRQDAFALQGNPFFFFFFCKLCFQTIILYNNESFYIEGLMDYFLAIHLGLPGNDK